MMAGYKAFIKQIGKGDGGKTDYKSNSLGKLMRARSRPDTQTRSISMQDKLEAKNRKYEKGILSQKRVKPDIGRGSGQTPLVLAVLEYIARRGTEVP